MLVLIVEDDPLFGSVIELWLKQDGFAVDWEQNADAEKLALR
ncbi:DNA-binding response regulator, partial [Burkholderia pseudomallei]